jgi:hypothetical protein
MEPVEMRVSARIKSVRSSPAKGDAPPVYAHGVQFEDLADKDRLRLQNFVLQRLNDGSISIG